MTTPDNTAGRLYVEVESQVQLIHLQGCVDCGVIVFDRDQHDEWHDEQESVSRTASRADGRTRRIG